MNRTNQECRDLIDETVAYYSADTSKRGLLNIGDDIIAFTNGNCTYFNDDTGNMCAVGRCMIAPDKLNSIERTHSVDVFDNLDSYLKDEYKGYDMLFWGRLQWLHDNTQNWDEKSITEDGKECVKILKAKYPVAIEL